MPQNGTDSVRPVPQWALDKAIEAQEADGRLDERFARILIETRAAALREAADRGFRNVIWQVGASPGSVLQDAHDNILRLINQEPPDAP